MQVSKSIYDIVICQLWTIKQIQEPRSINRSKSNVSISYGRLLVISTNVAQMNDMSA